jgi:hypothetical protein
LYYNYAKRAGRFLERPLSKLDKFVNLFSNISFQS